MKLKAPEIEIPSEDPFKNDLLGRKESAELLTELFRSTETPLVLCINAPWGNGKTTFLKMWLQALKNAKFQVLYFSAWENDFNEDALISLIGELSAGIEGLTLNSRKAKEVKKHLNKAKKLGAHLLKKGIPSAIKLATAGLLDLEKATEDALTGLSEKLAIEQIENYEKAKNTVARFKEELSIVADKITAVDDEVQRLPLVVIIDELDRCRPLYAIEVLEKAKHFFSVQNVVFVLAVDRVQLGHSIRTLYGNGIDFEGYLKRFTDIDYNLPAPEKSAFCKAQFNKFGLEALFEKRRGNESQFDYGNFQRIFSELFAIFGCSLREQERCFSLLSLAIRTTPNDNLIYPLLLGPLIVLKIKQHELYLKFSAGSIGVAEILDAFAKQAGGKEFIESDDGEILEAYLVNCMPRRHNVPDPIQSYVAVANDTAAHPRKKQRAENIARLLNSFEFRRNYGILNYLVKKIDMVSQFGQK